MSAPGAPPASPTPPARVTAEDVLRLARHADLRCSPDRAAVLAPHLAALLASADALVAAATAPGAADRAVRAEPTVPAPMARPAAPVSAARTPAPGGLRSIRELARAYRDGTRSPTAVTSGLLRRIERAEPRLNAFIAVLAESALAEARAAEARIRSGRARGPLEGIPVACKDNIDIAGVATTCGSRILRAEAAATDAPVVERLRAAGAVLIGKTNLLEFAYGIVHPDYGQCNNPWDEGRTAGGSSSGSAAAVAAGLVLGALGTDTGGSIRIPASYCGVVGLKPTSGRVSTDGVFPLSWTLDHVGPIAGCVDDAALLLAVLTGSAPPPAPPADGELRARCAGLRIALPVDRHQAEIRPGVARCFDAALSRLAAAGARLDRVELPGLESAEVALLQIILPEAAVIHGPWVRSRPEDYAPDTRLQLELGVLAPGTAYVAAQLVRDHLDRQTRRVLADHDLIATPTVAWVAPEHDPALADPEGEAEGRRTGPHNLTGVPALTLPCGLGEDQLPVGLQLAADWGEDERLLEWAAGVEAVLGGPLGPPAVWRKAA